MKAFKELSANVQYVVATKKSYIYFGMIVAIISLISLITIGSFLLSVLLCPVLSAALALCVINEPKRDEMLGGTMGWGVIFILFLFG